MVNVMMKKFNIYFLGWLQLFLLSLVLVASPVCSGAVDSSALSAEKLKKRAALLKRLKKLNLKELGTIQFFNPEATSAARTKRNLLDTAGALFVISSEDIRRAGITSIPEALRLAPGVQVGRVYADRWAISARGLNNLNSSKLLVMIDGRTIYTTRNASVHWNVQDILIEDIDRIEVIRGPGASLWGANAVNGIINIITKKAKQTQGNLLTTRLGIGEETAIVGVQHGGEIAKNAHYRVYGKLYEHDNFVDVQGEDAEDNWQMQRGGFRMDWDASKRNAFTLQGDVYDGFTKETKNLPNEGAATRTLTNDHGYLKGFNLLARWQHNLTNGDIILQSYFDWTKRNIFLVKEIRGTYDIDFQHRWQPNAQQEYIWGLGFRHVYDEFEQNHHSGFYDPLERQDNLFSAFMQAEFKLLSKSSSTSKVGSDLLRLTLGSKFEHNDYTGFEYQPTARLMWTPTEQHSAWAAVSRAIRVVTRAEEDWYEDGWLNSDLRFKFFGTHDLKSEVVTAYELGYRFTLSNRFLLDTSLFYNDYDQLRTYETRDIILSPLPPTVVVSSDSLMDGETYGIELAAQWQATKNWRLVATYSYMDMHLHLLPNSTGVISEATDEGNTPHNQATLRSLLTLSPNWEFDTALYYVDNLPSQHTPNYTRFDVRLGWQPQPDLTLSLGAKNLFDNQHPEFGSGHGANNEVPGEVQRAFYLQVNYQF